MAQLNDLIVNGATRLLNSLNVNGGINSTNGLLKISNYGNTTTIGSQNSAYCHIYNSTNATFIFNKSILCTSGDLGSTSYPFSHLYLTSNIHLRTPSSSSDDSGDIVWYYGNGKEKSRLWTADNYTSKSGPQYRVYKSDGTSLYSGTLPLADGTGASGTWGISVSGNAATATKLATTRKIFNKDFDGSADVAGQAFTYGTYTATASNRYSNGALQIRECGLVGNAQSDIGYAPAIGFHWGGRVGANLLLHSDGNFYFRKQDGTSRATIDANVVGNADTATTATNLTNFKVTTTSNLGIDAPGSNAIGYVSGLTKSAWNYQNTDGALYTQFYNASWLGEIYQDYRTGRLSVRGKNNGTWQDWLNIADATEYPTGTRYGTTTTTTKIKIKINSTSTWMLCFTVTLYQGYKASKVMVSGYQYGANYWYQPEAVLLGSSDGDTSISVYFGYDSANNLWVGFDGGNYTGVSISDVTNGYTQLTNYNGLFTISSVSSLATLQTTVTAKNKVDYATSAGSATSATSATTATTATKLGSSTVGGTTTPIYLNAGTPTALSYTIEKSVPSNAVFTDTNNAVTQTATTGSAEYECLFSVTADNTTRTEGARKSDKLKFNPSTGRLSITPPAANTAFPSGGIAVHDTRNIAQTPAAITEKGVNFFFSNNTMPDGQWWAGMHVHGWSSGYNAWEIVGPANASDNRTKALYVRTSNATSAWGSWRKIYDTSNPPTASEVGALASTVKYAGASTAGGSATSAVKLDTATAGSATQPCYFANGKPSACTYSLNKSVPSDAKFTDTTYSTANATYTLTKSSGTWTAGTVTAKRFGNVVHIAIAVVGTGAAVAALTNGFVGKITAGSGAALPALAICMPTLYNRVPLTCVVDTSGNVTFANSGMGSITIPNGTSVYAYGTFIVA